MCKVFATLATFISLLSSMCAFMSLEITVLCKGFTTMVTFTIFLSTMYYLTTLKRPVRYKIFSTLVILIGFLSSNSCFMYLETTVICKGFKILVTFIEFLSSMNSFLSQISLLERASGIGIKVFPQQLLRLSQLTMSQNLATLVQVYGCQKLQYKLYAYYKILDIHLSPVLELTLQTRLASNSEIFLPLPPMCWNYRQVPPMPNS